MHAFLQRSAMMFIIIGALFFVGHDANAAFRDWFNFWPINQFIIIQEEVPDVGAQEFHPEQPPVTPTDAFVPVSPTTHDVQPFVPENELKTNPEPVQDRFFCNLLGREASREECDKADQTRKEEQRQQEEKFRMESEQSRKEAEEKMRQEDMMKREEMMKKDEMMRRKQEERMKKEETAKNEFEPMKCPSGEFPGVNDQGQKGCIRPDHQPEERRDGPPPSFESPPFEGREEFHEPERPEFFIDKNQIRETNRQLLDLKRELNQVLKSAKRLKGGEALVSEIEGLMASVANFQQKFKSTQGEELQEAFEEFHDLRIWDTLNMLRTKIEMPKQLADAEKELKRTEKLLTQKAFKRLAEFGVNLEKIKSDLQNIRTTIDTVRNLMSAGNFEDVQDAMQDIWQGMHPGEIQGVLHQTRDLTENLRRIRNKDIRNEVLDIFQPVIASINEGDYREANALLQELQKEMGRIFQQLYRVRTSELDDKLQEKLKSFETKILDKIPLGIGGQEVPTERPVSEEGLGEGEFEEPRFFVDPRQLRQWVRETYDQQRELKRFLKNAKKLKGGEAFVTQIKSLLATVTEFQQKLRTQKADELQETIETFHETRIWDEVNILRARIELPKQLAEGEKALKRIEKLLKQKSFKKLTGYGIDLAKIQADLDAMRLAVTTAQKLLNEENFEDAMEAMREVFEGSHPGEIEGALQRMRGLTEGFARIRDKDIRKGVQEIFQPVIDAINTGDYREAHALLSELEPQMKKIFTQLYRARKKLSKQLKKKLGEFEALIQEKLPKEELLPEEFENPEEGLEPFGPPEELPIF